MTTPFQRLQRNGPLLILMAAAALGLMAVGVKAAAPLPSTEVTFLRFALALPLMAAGHFAGWWSLRFHNRPLIALRGLLGGAAVLCFFGAIERIHVGTATLFNNCFPFFALIVAVLVRQERLSPRLLAALALALGGIGVILAPRVGAVAFGPGAALGLLSAVFAGGAFVVIRQLRKTDEAPAIYTGMCLGGLLISSPLALLDYRAPSPRQWVWLAVVVISSTVGQLLMNHAMRFISASGGAIVAAAATAFATLFGHLLFGERYGWSFFAGAALVFSAAGFVAWSGQGDVEFSEDARRPVGLDPDEA